MKIGALRAAAICGALGIFVSGSAGLMLDGAQAAVIDYPANGSNINFWGPDSGGNQSYGQVFTAPQSFLIDYSFSVGSDTPYPFVSQVYQWDGTTATGPALFTSPTLATTTTVDTYTFTPNISLIAGNQYIAFVTNQPDGVGLGGSGLGLMAQSSVGLGQFYFAVLNPVGGLWDTFLGLDAAFHADFSSEGTATPLPAAVWLFAGGLGLLGMCYRKKEKPKSAWA